VLLLVGLKLFWVDEEGQPLLRVEGTSVYLDISSVGVMVVLIDILVVGAFVEVDVGDSFRFWFVFTSVIFTGCCNATVISTEMFAPKMVYDVKE
jgi:hypothetical protein